MTSFSLPAALAEERRASFTRQAQEHRMVRAAKAGPSHRLRWLRGHVPAHHAATLCTTRT